MANTSTDLAYRLLKLFPVKILRESFNTKGKSEDDVIRNILKASSAEDVQKFALDNFGYAKQHIYIHESNKPIKIDENDKDFPEKIKWSIQNDFGKGLILFPIITFRLTFINAFEERTMKFVQPVMVNLFENFLIFRFIILQKNFSSYCDPGQIFVNQKRNIQEKGIIGSILHYLSNDYTISPCDLHKGIKELIKDEKIDGVSVRYKGSKSTTTESMNEGFTLKRDKPERYDEMMASPLNKNVFKSVQEDDSFCEYFSCEPSAGEISVNKYSSSTQQSINVIKEILSNN